MREGRDAVLARPCVPCPGYSSTPGCLFSLYGSALPSSTIRPRRRGQMSLTPDPADPFVIGSGGRGSEIGQQRGNVRGLGGESVPPPATAFFRGTLRGIGDVLGTALPPRRCKNSRYDTGKSLLAGSARSGHRGTRAPVGTGVFLWPASCDHMHHSAIATVEGISAAELAFACL